MESSNGSGYRHTQNTMDFYFFFHFISASYTSWICHNGLEIREDSMVFFLFFLFFWQSAFLASSTLFAGNLQHLINKKVPALPKAQVLYTRIAEKVEIICKDKSG